MALKGATKTSLKGATKNDKMGFGETAYNTLVQLAYGVNKSVADTIDFFGPDIINGLLAEAGVEERVPTVRGALDTYVGESDLEEGLLKDAATRAGETATMALGAAGALRQGAKQLPAMMPGESAAMGAARQLTDIGPKGVGAEVLLGAAGGAGAEVGKEFGGPTGEAVLGALSPTGAAMVPGAARKAVGVVDDAVRMQVDPARGMIKEEAERLIQEQAKASGMTPDEIIARYKELGPEGMLADVDPVFAEAVRTITNEDMLLKGQVARQMSERQAGQGARIEQSLDQSMGTQGRSIDAELNILDQNLGPKIQKYYEEAANTPLALSPRLRGMIENPKGLFKDASREANKVLDTKRVSGEQITHFDIIDAHKKAMDDLIKSNIRKGNDEKARALIKAKNAMLEEVDAKIPAYKEARNLYAGKVALNDAYDLGMEFFKPKTKLRNIQEATATMTKQEKEYYKLGAKQAFQDIIDSEATTRDLVKKTFGKGGSMDKLKILFDDKKEFEAFRKTLQDEADFAITNRILQGNSTTMKQLKQDEKLNKKLMQTATNWQDSNIEKGRKFADIVRGINRVDDKEIFEQAKREAGAFLTNEGVDPKKVEALLQAGRERELKRLLDQTALKVMKMSAPTVRVVGAETATSEAE